MQRTANPFTPVRFRPQPPNIMKIGIIGYGFVGEALASAFKNNVEIFKVDPKLNTNIDDLKKFSPDTIFICVPTPMDNDGSIDLSILKTVLNDIKQNSFKCLIVIKSTIHPDNIKYVEKVTNNFIYNPEFLREKHAKEDFINSNLIIFGGNRELADKLSIIYSNYTKCKNKDYVYTDAISASLVKYAMNSFLATKVIFFNEFKDIFDISGTSESWENFIKIISIDKRIGDSHMDVPGHDGRLGFGGACFPKDTKALYSYSEKIQAPLNLLKKAIELNDKIRKSYEDKTGRESDQNIFFD